MRTSAYSSHLRRCLALNMAASEDYRTMRVWGLGMSMGCWYQLFCAVGTQMFSALNTAVNLRKPRGVPVDMAGISGSSETREGGGDGAEGPGDRRDALGGDVFASVLAEVRCHSMPVAGSCLQTVS